MTDDLTKIIEATLDVAYPVTRHVGVLELVDLMWSMTCSQLASIFFTLSDKDWSHPPIVLHTMARPGIET